MSKPTRTRSAPPALSAEARALWDEITKSHVVDDGASRALLRQLCESLDGLRAVQSCIAKDGLTTVGSKGQLRPHVLLGAESEYRRALLACARALRLDIQSEGNHADE